MTKLAIINDTHFGVRSDSLVFLDHQEKFFSEIFFPYLDENNIKIVLDLGDTFDRRKYINFVTLKRSREFFFDELQKRGITYHAIVGNHSTYYTNSNHVNSMDLLLQEYNDFHLYVDKPKELTYGSTKILLVPWITKTNGEIMERAMSETKAQFLMGHFEIKGFEFMKGSINDHGFEKSKFSKFEEVYSGHFHYPSEYGNIKYLGAQYEMTWTDYDGDRGFHVLDTETKELTKIQNPNRIFHKITYDDSDMTIEDVANLDVSMLKNTYLKVLVKNRTNSYLYDLFVEKLLDSGAVDVKTIEDSLNLESLNSETLLDEAKDTKDILHEYIDTIETSVDKKNIKTIIDTLYFEAVNLG